MSLNRVTQVGFLQVVAVVTGQTLLTHWLIDSGTVLDFSRLIFWACLFKAGRVFSLARYYHFSCGCGRTRKSGSYSGAQKSGPRLTITVLATKIMSLVFEETLATELLEEEDFLCLSGRKLRQFSNARVRLGEIFPRLGYLRPIDYLEILSINWSKYFLSTQTGFSQVEPHLMQGFDPKWWWRTALFLWLGLISTIMVMVQDPFNIATEAAMLNFQGWNFNGSRYWKRYHWTDWPLPSEFNHKAVYQLLARSPKESAARVFTPSQVMVGYLGFALAFDWWNTLAFNYNPQLFIASILSSILSLIGAGRDSPNYQLRLLV